MVKNSRPNYFGIPKPPRISEMLYGICDSFFDSPIVLYGLILLWITNLTWLTHVRISGSSKIVHLYQWFSNYATRPTLGTCSDFLWDARTLQNHYKIMAVFSDELAKMTRGTRSSSIFQESEIRNDFR